MPATCDIRPGPDLATVLQIASLDKAPAVTAAAHLLATELLSAETEACTACRALPDLCSRCDLMSTDAATHREMSGPAGPGML